MIPKTIWSNEGFMIIQVGISKFELRDYDCNTIAKFCSCEAATRYVYLEFFDIAHK